ncbi:UDP-2,4-diacetamido-2,4,6-trideoxy-beta-L-altropyranose hydrolase [Gottfriedia acidiceleris]|uniref:UDP-2,4-diacetamido-2,4, 6-trideoxy-beta-L-altropyranose hydrolase n=1 Tax=Gottfriedia acidiceleris TaxID=371036 RepID=UPI00101CBABC|nr:UDP-2,4-diacetamido-2,4,6-trideoxy-beta-L-altropyranose hydrolase [Gottfriedia acidiceleris]
MINKNIFFRVDASYEIGTGHVMRCLTLAHLFTNLDINISFICRDLPGNLNKLIVDLGYKVHILPGSTKVTEPKIVESPYEGWLKVDWKTDVIQTVDIISKVTTNSCLLIDHYAIDSNWEKLFYSYTGKQIIVIDDLANRSHFCNILLDQNISNNKERYDALVPINCVKFIGTEYVILRTEFYVEKIKLKERDGKIRRILVFFGGSDPTNETLKTIQVLTKPAYSDIHIDIVVGDTNLNKELIRSLCNKVPNFYFHCQINYIAELMRLADISIGAGGTTTWERCYLGVPTLTIVTAENQIDITNIANDIGVICNLGKSSKVTKERIEQGLNLLIQNPSKVAKMSQKALGLMGENKLNNFIERVVECLIDPD